MLKKKIFYLTLAFLLIILISSFLYSNLENLNTIDSLYITIITLTSLGFSKIFPKTEAGKILTMILALGGYTFLAGIITVVSSAILEGKLLENYRRKKMEKNIKSLKNHIIVCGGGDAGKYVIEELYKTKTSFVVIDKNQDKIDELSSKFAGLKYILGDATDDYVIELAGIHKAQGIIVVLPSDTENLYVIVTAKSRNPNINVISQAIEENNAKKLRDAGADKVLSSNSLIGTRLASLILRPSVTAFLDVINSFSEHGKSRALRLEEVIIPDRSQLIGKNIAYARIPHRTGLIIIAISKPDGSFHYNPSSVYEFGEKDKLIVLGNDEQIEKLKQFVKD